MEAVGLAISIISLAGIFKDCIDLFSVMSTAKSLEKDFKILSVKLDIEKTLLLQWAEHVRLVHEDYDRRLDNPRTKRTAARILESIKALLSDGTELERRYGMQRLRADHRDRFSILSAHRLEQFRSHFRKLKLNNHPPVEATNVLHQGRGFSQLEDKPSDNPASHKQNATLKEQFCWVVRDKENFGSLIQQLSELVRGLKEIVPLKQSTSVELLEQDVKQVKWIGRLELLMHRAKDHDQLDALTDMIQRQMDGQCQQRILNSLWYRMLDQRRNSVPEAHSRTFDWALNRPTEHVEWSNLSQWLQSGSGIYWIHGKPGSDKTTLMKYLYDSSMTRSLLFGLGQ